MQHISEHLNHYKNLSMQEFNNLHKTMNKEYFDLSDTKLNEYYNDIIGKAPREHIQEVEKELETRQENKMIRNNR
jgi:hypothetical protein